MPGRSVRPLILVPIIHTETDMGSLQESVRRHHIERTGAEQWELRQEAVMRLWETIATQIEGLNLDYRRVRLYQDGLPVCGNEEAIVRELAQEGSVNHQILLDLMAKGAKLTGTEAPELLMQEYKLARDALATPTHSRNTVRDLRHARLSKRLLEQRDDHIARQIDQTLKEGETGLIFLGILHALESHLPPDIRLSRFSDMSAAESRDGVAPSNNVRPSAPSTG